MDKAKIDVCRKLLDYIDAKDVEYIDSLGETTFFACRIVRDGEAAPCIMACMEGDIASSIGEKEWIARNKRRFASMLVAAIAQGKIESGQVTFGTLAIEPVCDGGEHVSLAVKMCLVGGVVDAYFD